MMLVRRTCCAIIRMGWKFRYPHPHNSSTCPYIYILTYVLYAYHPLWVSNLALRNMRNEEQRGTVIASKSSPFPPGRTGHLRSPRPSVRSPEKAPPIGPSPFLALLSHILFPKGNQRSQCLTLSSCLLAEEVKRGHEARVKRTLSPRRQKQDVHLNGDCK